MKAVLQILFQRKLVQFSFYILITLILSSIFASFISSHDPTGLDLINRLKPPSYDHFFGTDHLGRDIFSRVLFGARYSMTIGLAVMIFASILGVVIGLLAGYFRSLDGPLMRLVDAQMAFPDIILSIGLIAILGNSVINIILALSIVHSPRFARIVRSATLTLRDVAFVDAAKVLGVGTYKIIFVHILLNLLSPIMVQGTFTFAHAILAEAGLSFLGLGVSPETPTWGVMISESQGYIQIADWIAIFPGLAIVLTVLSLQVLGDGLRDLLDPKLKNEM